VLLGRLALAVTPLWLGPLAWRLACSSGPLPSRVGLILANLELLYVPVLLAALAALVVCTFGLLVREYREGALTWLLCSAVFVGSFIGGMKLGRHIRNDQLFETMERAQPLIDAISAYQADHSRPPATLDELVPKYLDRIPETGIGAWPAFRYFANHPDRHHGNPWVLIVIPPNLIMGFDSFAYVPRRNYSEAGYTPMGTWGYFYD
jgi:hypothetical protein